MTVQAEVWPAESGSEAAVQAMYESADPVKTFAADRALFGELAGKPEFEALLREQVEEVRKLIA